MSTEQPTHITVERIEIPEDVRRNIAANLRLGRYLASVERLEDVARGGRSLEDFPIDRNIFYAFGLLMLFVVAFSGWSRALWAVIPATIILACWLVFLCGQARTWFWQSSEWRRLYYEACEDATERGACPIVDVSNDSKASALLDRLRREP